MQSTMISLMLAAGTVSASVFEKRQTPSNLVDAFEAIKPIVLPNSVIQPGAAPAIWALSEEQLVSIFQSNASGKASKLSKRSSPPTECMKNQPNGPYPQTNLPKYTPDTPDKFRTTFANYGQSSGVVVPNYYQIPGWSNLKAAGPGAGYFGLKYLEKYDVKECADVCSSTKSCAAFNLYIERDPSVAPNYPPAPCSDPASVSTVKCVLYNTPFPTDRPVSSYVNNYGQYRGGFLVVIAASLGYNLGFKAPNVPGYCKPISLPAAINTRDGSYIREETFDTQKVGSDPSYCRYSCDAQRNYADQHDPATPGYPRCRAFVGYTLAKNGGAGGTALQCALYSGSQNPKDATNYGQTRGSDTYKVANAYLYNNIADCSAK